MQQNICEQIEYKMCLFTKQPESEKNQECRIVSSPLVFGVCSQQSK